MNFEEFKAEIIRRAKGKYSGAFIGSLNDVIDYPSLMTVIKQEFRLLVKRQILDAPFIESHKTEFNAHGIFLNENVNNGFLLAENSPIVVARGNSIVIARDSSSVVARDGSSVEAWGSSSVTAWDSSSVVARDGSSVEAWDRSTVEARDRSSVVAWDGSSVVARDGSSVVARDRSTVEARDRSTVEARDSSTVEARDSSSVVARGNSPVTARDSSYIVSHALKECMLHDNAIYRITSRNTVMFASDSIVFEKQRATDEPEAAVEAPRSQLQDKSSAGEAANK